MTDDEQNEDIIGKIGNDEIKHFKNFTDLYIKLYKKRPPLPEVNKPQILTFQSGVKKSILDELDAYEFYRNIYINNVNPDVKRDFFEAMTDEIEHASKFNYIYTKTLEKKV